MSTEEKNLISQALGLSFFLIVLIGIGFSRESSPPLLRPSVQEDSLLLKASQEIPLVLYTKRIESGWFLADDAPPSLIKTSIFGVTTSFERKRIHPIEYIVKRGDTLEKIARKFQIKIETILAANDISNPELIRPGMILTILPEDGILYLLSSNDNLETVSEKFQVPSTELVKWNPEAEFIPGEVVFVPGVQAVSYKPNLKNKALARSFFICPLTGSCTITQGIHPYNAVDISHGKCGEPVLASAGGRVKKVGYSRIGGNYVLIDHGRGVYTYYGHMSKIIVQKGERVRQGDVIGYTGNTGFTLGPTGCHVHFEVRGATNPFGY